MVIGIFAALCGVLAGLGVGSGGLFAVAMTLALGYSQLEAQSMNLVFFAASSAAAVVMNMIKKRIVWGVVLPVAIFGCVGAVGGAFIASRISLEILPKLFGAMLIACGAISFLKKGE